MTIIFYSFRLESETEKTALKMHIPDQTLLFNNVESLRWILLPFEVKQRFTVSKSSHQILAKSPFLPRKYGQTKPPKGSYFGKESVIFEIQSMFAKTTPSWLDFKLDSKKNGTKSETEGIAGNGNLKLADENLDIAEALDACLITKRPEKAPVLDIKAKWRPPTKDIFKPFLEAVDAFEMIKPGDRVLVCLSGGKDSLSLLHTMKQYQFYTKNSFQLGAMTIDPQSSAYDPRPLIPYLQELGKEKKEWQIF